MELKILNNGDINAWDNYVEKHPEGTFFHLAAWQQVIKQAFGHNTFFYFVSDGGEICGVLPLCHVKSALFGNNLVSLPFAVYGGVLASNDEARKMLEAAALEKAKELSVDTIEYRNIKPQHSDWPSKDLYVTFQKEIDPDEEKNLSNIPRKQRAMVRKGIKAGLSSEIEYSTDRFYEAYAQSVHALGTPVFSKRYFDVLLQEFKNKVDVLTITKEGELIASVLNFYFRDQVLPFYGGGTAKARNVKGNDFMYWELMRLSCERGIKVFDYGRSKVGTGAYSFKKNWGFEPQPLSYEYVLVNAKQIPEVNPSNPKYAMFINIWKKLPYWSTKMIGPHIVKYVG